MSKNTLIRKRETQALLSSVIVLLTVGTLFYSLVEKWSVIDSLYFSTMTLTTVGYGDIAPITTAGKLFTIVYVFLGIGIFLGLITILAEFARINYFEHSEYYLKKVKGNIKNALDKDIE